MTDWRVFLIDIEITALSGLRVGAQADVLETDSPILRDRRDRPLIPGSSLKGVMRSSAERFLRAHESALACDILADPCVARLGMDRTQEPNPEGFCWVCRLFGNTELGGRLFVGDMAADDALTMIRDGVAIDRETLAQRSRLKFDYEVAAAGTTFNGRIRIDDPEPGDAGLILAILDLMNQDLVRIGGGTSRGLGQVAVKVCEMLVWSAAQWKPGTAPEPADQSCLARELADRLAAAVQREGPAS